jgi:hypothetical protein
MGGDGSPDRGMGAVAHAVLPADLLDDVSDDRVGELEHDAQAQSLDQPDAAIDESDLPQRMEKKRDCERRGEKREGGDPLQES